MNRRPLGLTRSLLASSLVFITVGCAASATPSAAGDPSETPSSTISLAPAGPPPGGAVDEADPREDEPAVAGIVRSIGCVEGEVQEPLPLVTIQLSCRIGTERVYVLTFETSADRDAYLGEVRGPQVVTGGWNITGPAWVVHVETEATAVRLAKQLQADATPGSD